MTIVRPNRGAAAHHDGHNAAHLWEQTGILLDRMRGVEGAPTMAVHQIPLWGPKEAISAEDMRTVVFVDKGMDGYALLRAEAYVVTAGTGDTTVQVRNMGLDSIGPYMLSTEITIDSGEVNSMDAATQPVVDEANANVVWGDHLAIDVLTVATGALGLGVVLTFGVPRI